eukprot:227243-Chlamydomonas_euryale.AAC.14
MHTGLVMQVVIRSNPEAAKPRPWRQDMGGQNRRDQGGPHLFPGRGRLAAAQTATSSQAQRGGNVHMAN